MVTRRDCSAITKQTRSRGSPASVSTSTVNRSQAVRPSPCACRNVFQGRRRGYVAYCVQKLLGASAINCCYPALISF